MWGACEVVCVYIEVVCVVCVQSMCVGCVCEVVCVCVEVVCVCTWGVCEVGWGYKCPGPKHKVKRLGLCHISTLNKQP